MPSAFTQFSACGLANASSTTHLLCGRYNRPHYASCPSFCLSVSLLSVTKSVKFLRCVFLPLHAFSNGAVMPSLGVRPSVRLSVCDVGEH